MIVDNEEITDFCRKEGIVWLAIFGSAVRNELTEESDIDILVEFEKPVGLFELVRIEDRLTELFGGRKVDLVIKNGLDKYIRDKVLSTCEVIYGKAG